MSKWDLFGIFSEFSSSLSVERDLLLSIILIYCCHIMSLVFPDHTHLLFEIIFTGHYKAVDCWSLSSYFAMLIQ